MSPILHYSIIECEQPGCRLRFPLIEGSDFSGICPRCGALTRVANRYDLAGDRRGLDSSHSRLHLQALLDNIRSAWNVGSMFRTADGVGMEHLYLCGITPTPKNPKVTKTSLNAEKAIPWSYAANGLDLCVELRRRGVRLWALESTDQAEPIHSAVVEEREEPIVLVVGNEICGIDPAILRQCERVLQIPMVGVKSSYNAAVAFGIAAYSLGFAKYI